MSVPGSRQAVGSIKTMFGTIVLSRDEYFGHYVLRRPADDKEVNVTGENFLLVSELVSVDVRMGHDRFPDGLTGDGGALSVQRERRKPFYVISGNLEMCASDILFLAALIRADLKFWRRRVRDVKRLGL